MFYLMLFLMGPVFNWSCQQWEHFTKLSHCSASFLAKSQWKMQTCGLSAVNVFWNFMKWFNLRPCVS